MTAPTSRRKLSQAERTAFRERAAAVLARVPDVVAAYWFGSAARGEPARDLDIGVFFGGRVPGFLPLDRIAAEIQEKAAPDGPEIDLRPLDGTAPLFRYTVLREGIRLYERDAAARLRFEVKAQVEWLDFRPFWLRERSANLARWKRA